MGQIGVHIYTPFILFYLISYHAIPLFNFAQASARRSTSALILVSDAQKKTSVKIQRWSPQWVLQPSSDCTGATRRV